MSDKKSKTKKKKEAAFFRFLRNKGESGIEAIAKEYAEEEDGVTMKAIAENHSIPETLVKQIIEYAICNGIIKYQVCLKIKAKAHRNQISHYFRGQKTTSDAYYDKLFERRFDHLKKTLAIEDIMDIISVYLKNPKHSVSKIAEMTGYSEREVKYFLTSAIAFGTVVEDTAEKIISVALEKNPKDSRAKEKFERLLKDRRNFIALEERRQEIVSELEAMESDDEDAEPPESPEADELRIELNDVFDKLGQIYSKYC